MIFTEKETGIGQQIFYTTSSKEFNFYLKIKILFCVFCGFFATSLPARGDIAGGYDWCFNPIAQSDEISIEESVQKEIKMHPDRYINGNGWLFKIKNTEKNSEITIIGSMHNSFSLSYVHHLQKYYETADDLIFETNQVNNLEKVNLPDSWLKITMNGYNINMNEEKIIILKQILKELSIPYSEINNVPILFILDKLNDVKCDFNSNQTWKNNLGIDSLIALWAKFDGKKTSGIQTAGQIMKENFPPMDTQSLFRRLDVSLSLYFSKRAQEIYMVKNIMEKKVDKAIASLSRFGLTDEQAEFMWEQNQKPIRDRNVIMARKISEKINVPGNHLVMIGAAHLLGRSGVIQLLEDMGYIIVKEDPY